MSRNTNNNTIFNIINCSSNEISLIKYHTKYIGFERNLIFLLYNHIYYILLEGQIRVDRAPSMTKREGRGWLKKKGLI